MLLAEHAFCNKLLFIVYILIENASKRNHTEGHRSESRYMLHVIH